MPVTDDVVVAHIARLALGDDGSRLPPNDERDAPFSEMAMYVLVRRDGGWWLAAGQQTPMRPGGAVPARGETAAVALGGSHNAPTTRDGRIPSRTSTRPLLIAHPRAPRSVRIHFISPSLSSDDASQTLGTKASSLV